MNLKKEMFSQCLYAAMKQVVVRNAGEPKPLSKRLRFGRYPSVLFMQGLGETSGLSPNICATALERRPKADINSLAAAGYLRNVVPMDLFALEILVEPSHNML